MAISRRKFLSGSAVSIGGITFLPFINSANAMGGDAFPTTGGDIKVHPVAHASFVMESPVGTIYCDPVGDAAKYAEFPNPDLILITHHHGDHFKVETLAAIKGEKTQIITNPTVFEKLPEGLKARAKPIANGESQFFKTLGIDAIPAHNLTEGRMKFHPKGRDNGYVLNFDNFRIYISGDTEDIPEMRALKDISLAFVCMNLPFTMDVKAAASAVAEFKPGVVYPYHYRGRDGGTQDPKVFEELVGEMAKVKQGKWYG